MAELERPEALVLLPALVQALLDIEAEALAQVPQHH